MNFRSNSSDIGWLLRIAEEITQGLQDKKSHKIEYRNIKISNKLDNSKSARDSNKPIRYGKILGIQRFLFVLLYKSKCARCLGNNQIKEDSKSAQGSNKQWNNGELYRCARYRWNNRITKNFKSASDLNKTFQ